MIRVQQLNPRRYDVFLGDVCLGDFTQEQDGHFYFYSNIPSGSPIRAVTLAGVAQKLDEVNKYAQGILEPLYPKGEGPPPEYRPYHEPVD